MASVQELKREFTKAIRRNKAAIFAGAGLSCGSGFVNWKELLRELATDINLNVDKENDLVSVAQYYFNEKGGRGQINQNLMNCFTKYVEPNENMEILSRLPIHTYWTTNYDSLIEDSLKTKGKVVDVKFDSENFSNESPNASATVYKMHGDINYPSKAILTKDDYESYNETRQIFTTALQGDLVKKTFLFIGCSMTDPNMKYILSRLRLLLQDNQRTHYCLLKRISKQDYVKNEISDENEYNYAVNKRNLEIRDLRRYGIDVVQFDEYTDIPKILKDIEVCCQLRNIYISGSAQVYGELWEGYVQKFIRRFTEECFERDFKITTGYGNGVGSFVISTVLEKVLETHDDLDKYLCLRPFPYEAKYESNYAELKYKYRTSMIEPTGVGLFIFGNKKVNGKIVLADGVFEEFNICKKLNKLIIPIVSTGYATEEIFHTEIENNLEEYEYLTRYLGILNNRKEINDSNIEKIINTIFEIIMTCYNNIITS